MLRFLRGLYHSRDEKYNHYRWAMVALDVAIVLFFIATTFIEHTPMPMWLMVVDYLIGFYLLTDWLLRGWACPDRLAYLVRPLVIIDLVVIASLFTPALIESFLFLRILRTLRLLRSYHLLADLREDSRFFRQREEVIFSALNLVVFIFVVSALVYALQVRVNSQIINYIDALYFTVTTLTTTGFGDITLTGTQGRILSVFVMIVGVSLFLRLMQAIFRPSKVSFECPDCGLNRHEHDAVHCKHCGHVLHIATEGI